MADSDFTLSCRQARRLRLFVAALTALLAMTPLAGADPAFVGPPSEKAESARDLTQVPAASNAPVNISDGESRIVSPAVPVRSASEDLPLGRSASEAAARVKSDRAEISTSGVGWWVQTGAALLLVVALIFAVKWGAQRLARRAGSVAWQMGPAGRAPSGVLEVLGRYPVARGQSLVLLRLDRRILLLGQSGAGFSMLSELTDPEEVASLLVKTRDDEGASMAARFNELLREMERDPSVGGDTQDIQSGEPATGPRLPRIGLKGVTA